MSVMHVQSRPPRVSRRRRVIAPLLVVVVTLVLLAAVAVILGPAYFAPSHRPRYAKAAADTRALASGIRLYARHCGGLPAGDSQTDCPVAAAAGGPYVLPRSLLLPQTNREGYVAGPFFNAPISLPSGWTGAGASYAYYILEGGAFVVCAYGDGRAENSDGGHTCP
jgi:hypothetical protein